jgi:hypothetical protein
VNAATVDRRGILPGSVLTNKRAKAKAKDSRESAMCAESSGIRPGSVQSINEKARESTRARAKAGKEGTTGKEKECGK